MITRLKDYAKRYHVTYRTAQNWYYDGKIPGAKKLPSGSIIVEEQDPIVSKTNKNIIYCRISNDQDKQNLEIQAQRCLDFCANQGIVVDKIVKEVGSGTNDSRKLLSKYLYDPDCNIVVESSDRLTKTGLNYIQNFMEMQNRKLIVLNKNQEKDGTST